MQEEHGVRPHHAIARCFRSWRQIAEPSGRREFIAYMCVVLAAYATVLFAAFVLLKISQHGGTAKALGGADTAVGILSLLLIVGVSVPIPALVCRRGRDAGLPRALVALLLVGWLSPVLQNVLDAATPASWAHAIADVALALQMTWLTGILALASLPTKHRQA